MSDIALTAANFIPSVNASIVDGLVAGSALTRGNLFQYDSASGTYKALDVTNTSKDTLYGICLEDVAIGQRFSGVIKDSALALGGTIASGDTVWASATGVTKTIGDLTTGWRIISLGIATGSGILNFNPTRGGVK
ncbi:MAG TPA: hypothetical protein VHW03_04560 [Chthoniobacterales bacterium]|jgi:hypothetical protein|nr:hypothetical protein [Chthoniobacterales bacterium]